MGLVIRFAPRAESALDRASSLAKTMEIDYVCELREGRSADEILKAAAQHQCDLIVIGSRGRKGVSRVTLGETGNEVVLKASVPVLVVKERMHG